MPRHSTCLGNSWCVFGTWARCVSQAVHRACRRGSAWVLVLIQAARGLAASGRMCSSKIRNQPPPRPPLCSRLFSARQFRANFRLSADLALQSRHLAQPTRSLEQQTPRSPSTSKAHRSRSRLAETAAWRMLTAGVAPRWHVSLSGRHGPATGRRPCWTPYAAAMSAADGPLGALLGLCCHCLGAGRMQPGRASDEYMLSWKQYETRQRCKE